MRTLQDDKIIVYPYHSDECDNAGVIPTMVFKFRSIESFSCLNVGAFCDRRLFSFLENRIVTLRPTNGNGRNCDLSHPFLRDGLSYFITIAILKRTNSRSLLVSLCAFLTVCTIPLEPKSARFLCLLDWV